MIEVWLPYALGMAQQVSGIERTVTLAAFRARRLARLLVLLTFRNNQGDVIVLLVRAEAEDLIEDARQQCL
jgi:hypothetical protein